jgi:hypothetical protein
MGIEELPPEALVEITKRLSIVHSFKLWLIGNNSLCRKLLIRGGLQHLRMNSRKLKAAPPLQNFPLLAALTHIDLSTSSYRPPFEVDASFILTLPRKLVSLRLQSIKDHLAFQSAYNQDPERFEHLKTLILLGNGIVGNATFAAKATKFPPNLTKFQSFHVVDDSSQLVFPPHLQDLFLRVQGPQGFLPLPNTLERVELRFQSIPPECPDWPSNLTWLEVWLPYPENTEAWDFSCLPPALEHLGLDSLNEKQINSLPLSIRSLEGVSDYVMKDSEIKSLSRLVNLTSISGLLPHVLQNGLASFLPHRLQFAATSIPLSELPRMPRSITNLQLTDISQDAPDPFYSRSLPNATHLDMIETPSELGTGVVNETLEENAVWPFPSLTALKLNQLTPHVAKRLPEGLDKLRLGPNAEGITLEVAQQLSSKKLKYLSAGLLHTESCIAALPRTLTHLEGEERIPLTIPDRYLVMNTENSSFDFPRSLTHLNLGTIHIDCGTWFNGLPKTLEHLAVGVLGAQETDFGNLDFPPLLTVLELVVHITPNQGILPLLYSIPKGVRNLKIPKVGEKDPGLTNETFCAWIQSYSSLRFLLLPQSRAVYDVSLHMLPKRLKRLEFQYDRIPGIPSWAPGY